MVRRAETLVLEPNTVPDDGTDIAPDARGYDENAETQKRVIRAISMGYAALCRVNRLIAAKDEELDALFRQIRELEILLIEIQDHASENMDDGNNEPDESDSLDLSNQQIGLSTYELLHNELLGLIDAYNKSLAKIHSLKDYRDNILSMRAVRIEESILLHKTLAEQRAIIKEIERLKRDIMRGLGIKLDSEDLVEED
jgi:hypothetical protein